MKKLLLLSVVIAIVFGCKKDNQALLSYGNLDRAQIEANAGKMTETPIDAIGASGNILKPGAVILFKTNTGKFGKMQIVSIDDGSNFYLLKFNLVVYADNGSELKNEAATSVKATWYYDLDNAMQILDSTGDFSWNASDPNGIIYSISPVAGSGAVFYLYSN